MRLKSLFSLALAGLALAACRPGTPSVTPTVAPSETPTPLQVVSETPTPEWSPTPEPSPVTTVTAEAPVRPDEAILLQEPGPGSRVKSPVRVVGFADPTFEQNLVVRIVAADGTELAQVPTNIEADVGQRGRFALEVPLQLGAEQNIFIQVYATSPRDGGLTHLSSTGVFFSPGRLENISIQEPHPERIAIFQPQPGTTINNGIVHVEGFALASFEQTLVVEILNRDGEVIGSQPVTVQAPDLGQPGPFSADVAYSLSEPGPGRVVVRDPSPAFGGDVHLSSVELNLEP